MDDPLESSLMINLHKCSTIFSKICEESIELQKILNSPVSEQPITYLGRPITAKKKSSNQYWKLIQPMREDSNW